MALECYRKGFAQKGSLKNKLQRAELKTTAWALKGDTGASKRLISI